MIIMIQIRKNKEAHEYYVKLVFIDHLNTFTLFSVIKEKILGVSGSIF